MRAPTRLPLPVRRALGLLQYASFAAIGRLTDASAWAYRVDATLSLRRLHRHLARQEARDRRHPEGLRWSESSSFSQNGEDGVIAEVLRRIGTTTRWFVEIGAADGEENCTRNLLEQGWRGVWIEADPDRAARAAAVGGERVTVVAEAAHAGGVAEQLRRAGTPAEPDVLVVDIDSHDLDVLAATLRAFRPRLVVVEYNAAFSPAAIWSLPRTVRGGWDGTFRQGASLGALQHMADAAGYQLVHCDSRGVNAFFVRTDLGDDRFPMAGHLAEQHRVAAFTSHGFGHARGRRAVADMAPLPVDELRRVTVADLRVPRTVRAGEVVDVRFEVRNDSSRVLTSGGRTPLNLSVRWVHEGDAQVPPDAPRTSLPRAVPPGSSLVVRLWVTAPATPGPARLRATVVCESVFWREDVGGPGASVDATTVVQPA